MQACANVPNRATAFFVEETMDEEASAFHFCPEQPGKIDRPLEFNHGGLRSALSARWPSYKARCDLLECSRLLVLHSATDGANQDHACEVGECVRQRTAPKNHRPVVS